MSIAVVPYGTLSTGEPVELYQMHNASGMAVEITNYGARIVSIKVPDRTGKIDDVTLGYDTVAGWEGDRSFFGAVVGRYANRIAGGRFTLDGKTYQLPVNNPPNSLHGGVVGFSKRRWTGETISEKDHVGVKFTLVSEDGDQGYPGKVTAQVTYTLGQDNELRMDYRVTSDAPTVVSLTNHCYFNLKGEGNGDILDHEVQIDAARYTATDGTQIPTGELASVAGTPLDLRKLTRIGEHIDDPFPAMAVAGGYDHNFVLDGTGLREVAKASEPTSGRVLEVLTTEPGVQFYTGNGLGNRLGRDGHHYPPRTGFCLETQHFPDSPNHPAFPSTVLRPGEVYTSTTIFRFPTPK